MCRDNGKFRDGTYSLTAPSIDLANVHIIIITSVIVFIVIFFFNGKNSFPGYTRGRWYLKLEMFLFFR